MSFVYCGLFDSVYNWVLNKIISPVFDWVKSVLNSVFTFLYKNVIGPILDATIGKLARSLLDWIIDIIFQGLFYISKYVLQILDCLADLFDTMLGVTNVKFRGEEMTLLRAFLNIDAVRKAFWYINFFALGLAVIFAVYGVARSMMDMDFENKRPVSRVLASLLNSVLNLFTIQLVVFGIIYLAEAILTGLNSAVALANGSTENTTLGRMIFIMGTLNAALNGDYNMTSDAVVNGRIVIGPGDDIRKRFYGLKDLSAYNLKDVQLYFNLRKLDYFVLIAVGAAFALLLLLGLLVAVRRIFNMLLLYIVSPLFAATIPLDDGEVFGKWRNLFIGTCFTGYGMLVSMKLYLLICPMIMGSELQLTDSIELDFVCRIVFLMGGLWAVYNSSSMITGLISGDAAGAENEAKNTGESLAKWGFKTVSDHLKKNADKNRQKLAQQRELEKNGALGQDGSQRFDGKNSGPAGGAGSHGADNAFLGNNRNSNNKLEGALKNKDKEDKDKNRFGAGISKTDDALKNSAARRSTNKMRNQAGLSPLEDMEEQSANGKNGNAFQERKGAKTMDSMKTAPGKKKLDKMRAQFGLNDAEEAANADPMDKAAEGKKPNGDNKSDNKTDLNKKNTGKIAGSKAKGGMKSKDDSDLMETSKLGSQEMPGEKASGAFQEGAGVKTMDSMKTAPGKKKLDKMRAQFGLNDAEEAANADPMDKAAEGKKPNGDNKSDNKTDLNKKNTGKIAGSKAKGGMKSKDDSDLMETSKLGSQEMPGEKASGAFQEGAGVKTMDSMKTAPGKKKLDAMRTQFGLNDAEAAASTAPLGEAAEGNKQAFTPDQTEQKGSAGASVSKARNNSGMTTQRPTLESLDDVPNTFGGGSQDDTKLNTHRRPQLDVQGGIKYSEPVQPTKAASTNEMNEPIPGIEANYQGGGVSSGTKAGGNVSSGTKTSSVDASGKVEIQDAVDTVGNTYTGQATTKVNDNASSAGKINSGAVGGMSQGTGSAANPTPNTFREQTSPQGGGVIGGAKASSVDTVGNTYTGQTTTKVNSNASSVGKISQDTVVDMSQGTESAANPTPNTFHEQTSPQAGGVSSGAKTGGMNHAKDDSSINYGSQQAEAYRTEKGMGSQTVHTTVGGAKTGGAGGRVEIQDVVGNTYTGQTTTKVNNNASGAGKISQDTVVDMSQGTRSAANPTPNTFHEQASPQAGSVSGGAKTGGMNHAKDDSSINYGSQQAEAYRSGAGIFTNNSDISYNNMNTSAPSHVGVADAVNEVVRENFKENKTVRMEERGNATEVYRENGTVPKTSVRAEVREEQLDTKETYQKVKKELQEKDKEKKQ